MTTSAAALSPQDSTALFKARVEFRINPKTEAFAKQLKLSVNQGILTLEGAVPTDIDRANAERVALSLMDVTGVVNKLTVAR